MSTRGALQIRRVESLEAEKREMDARIRDRAYERSLQRGERDGSPENDWAAATDDLVVRSPVIVSEVDNQIVVYAEIPSMEPRDIEVLATENQLLIRSIASPPEVRGIVHIREFLPRRVFRIIDLPRPVSVEGTRTEFQNGMLRMAFPAALAQGYQAKTA